MGLSDVVGVFSRYFIVGFYLPTFFVAVVLSQALTQPFLPVVYRDASVGGQIAILGGAALLVGLVLSGIHYSVLRLVEGYPLLRIGDRWYARPVLKVLMSRQRRRYAAAEQEAQDPARTAVERRDAVWRLDLTFPSDGDHLLMPTAFGNAIRAFERHSRIRWGLNSIAVWDRIEMLLSEQETQVHADARGDLAFFVNGSILSALAGLVLIVDVVANRTAPPWLLLASCLVIVILSRTCYLAACGAAIRWGNAVRASIDIHRLEFYEKIGVRRPTGFRDERMVVAPAVNAVLLRGESIDDDLAASRSTSAGNGRTIRLGSLSLHLQRTSADRKDA